MNSKFATYFQIAGFCFGIFVLIASCIPATVFAQGTGSTAIVYDDGFYKGSLKKMESGIAIQLESGPNMPDLARFRKILSARNIDGILYFKFDPFRRNPTYYTRLTTKNEADSQTKLKTLRSSIAKDAFRIFEEGGNMYGISKFGDNADSAAPTSYSAFDNSVSDKTPALSEADVKNLFKLEHYHIQLAATNKLLDLENSFKNVRNMGALVLVSQGRSNNYKLLLSNQFATEAAANAALKRVKAIPAYKDAFLVNYSNVTEDLFVHAISSDFYTVRKGDTLFGIAKKSGVSVKNIQDWNKMGSRTSISVGQTLRVSM